MGAAVRDGAYVGKQADAKSNLNHGTKSERQNISWHY